VRKIKKRLGILRCDTVLPEFQDRFATYSKMFCNLHAAVGAEYKDIEIKIYNVEKAEYPSDLNECGAYITTGSRASVYQQAEWIKLLGQFIIELNQQKRKLVGICFGHQLIAQALGGQTRKSDKGWGIGIHISQVVEHCDWMTPSMDAFNLVVSHQDQVMKLPCNARLIATNEFCPNSSFIIDDHILSFQGHPEFSKQYSEALMLHRLEIIGEQTVRDAQRSLKLKSDEIEIMKWILNFCFDIEIDHA